MSSQSQSLVICEKPSQARNLRAALGERFGEILPAQGHLVRLMEPDEAKDEWKEWSADLLHPGKPYPKVPATSPSQRSKLKAIRDALRTATQVIIATDCDREGQLIGQEILDFCGYKGKTLRAMFNKEDPKSLQEAFGHLRPATDFLGLYNSGRAREQADQICNLSLTRAATVSLKAGGKGAIGIGRVKTPTLSIVCRRELEILNFKPQTYFEVIATTEVSNGTFTMSCGFLPEALRRQEASEGVDDDPEASEDDAAFERAESLAGKIVHEKIATLVANAARGWKGPLSHEAKDCKQLPPQLFDLTALQAACSARFGWGGDKTLEVAQSLYSERQIITYPRAEGRHLGENQMSEVGPLLGALLGLPDYQVHRKLLSNPVVRKGKSGTFSDKALENSAHHGIAPNFNTRDRFDAVIKTLTADERRMWDMVARSYLAALAPDYEYRQTTIQASVPCAVPVKTSSGPAEVQYDWLFRTSGRTPIFLGWKEILGSAELKSGKGGANSDEEPELPSIVDQEPGHIIDANLAKKTTKAPVRYTEGTLLKAMKEAWRFVDKPDLRAKLKETEGIGTTATRAAVVSGLLAQGQLMKKGKQLLPSEVGLGLFKLLDEVAPDLTDPARTAAWETLFKRVELGQDDFMNVVGKLSTEAKKSIDRIVAAGESGVSIQVGRAQKPTEKMVQFATSLAERAGIKLPADVKRDSVACRRFIDEHAPKREGGEGAASSGAPSDRQLEFANRIAQTLGIQLPDEAIASGRSLASWLDENKGKASMSPSSKQLAFARRLADENGLDFPPDLALSSKSCSAFIDKHLKGKQGSGRARAGSR